MDSRAGACKAKDIDWLMLLCSLGIVYCAVVPPLQFTGPADVRRNFLRWLGEYLAPIGLETHELVVAVSSAD